MYIMHVFKSNENRAKLQVKSFVFSMRGCRDYS